MGAKDETAGTVGSAVGRSPVADVDSVGDSARIFRYVVDVFDEAGCRWEELAPHVLRIVNRGEGGGIWGVDEGTVIALDPSAARDWPDARLWTPVSDGLEALVRWGKERAGAGGLFCPVGLDPEWAARLVLRLGALKGRNRAFPRPVDSEDPTMDAMIAACEQIGFDNASVRLDRWHLVYQRRFLFAFRLTFIADEQQQSVWPILIDPVTEEARPLPQGARWVPLPILHRGQGGGADYSVGRLFRAAQRALPDFIAGPWEDFCRRVERRKREEGARIDDYYRSLRMQEDEAVIRWQLSQDASRLRAFLWGTEEPKPSPPLDPSPSPDPGCPPDPLPPFNRLPAPDPGPAAEWDGEWRLRVEELEWRYRPRAEAELVYGAVVVVPGLEVHWRVAHPRRRNVITFYDVLAAEWLDWRCEQCDARLERGDGSGGAEVTGPVIADDGTVCCDGCAPDWKEAVLS